MMVPPHCYSILLWGGIIFFFLMQQNAGIDYKALYGGIVAQTVPNASISDLDVAEAITLATKHAKVDGTKYFVTTLEKQRLYYSTDGVYPWVYQRQLHGGYVQQGQMILGLLYSFFLSCNQSRHQCGSDAKYHFLVSCDRNKDYHIFKQTSVVQSKANTESHQLSEKVNTCRNHKVPWFHPVAGVQSLRAAGYNIWNINRVPVEGEKYETRLKRLGKLISSLNVDVFGFQEVRLKVGTKNWNPRQKNKKSKTTNTPATQAQISQLASLLPGYHFIYQPAMLFMEKAFEREEEGVAIFSRYPIISSDYRLLFRNESDSEDFHQRACLHAELLIPHFGSVHVFVSHLSLSQKSRERSVVEIWKYMQKFSGIKLLIGDMNAEPLSKEVKFLTGEVSLDNIWTDGLLDTWTIPDANADMPGFTFSALDDEAVKRIDYIFASIPHPSNVYISTSEIIIDTKICHRPCSDHHLLLTVFNS